MKDIVKYVKVTGGRILFGSLLLLSVCYGQLTFPDVVNPHGQGQCATCHVGQGEPAKNNVNPNACITCHSRAAVNDKIHQLDNINIKKAGITIPSDFKMEMMDKFSCITCHAVTCKTDRANQTFLRGGPYKVELDFCYQCHSQEKYAGINPHLQVREDGTVDKSTCLQCHAKQPNKEDHPTIAREMHLDMSATCNKCHFLHTHEENHQGKSIQASKKATMERFYATQTKYGITLPLSDDKLIQCNTCHYTHNRGTLSEDQVIYEGENENQRYLRLEKENLCYACHDL